jgi:hypothetical protein
MFPAGAAGVAKLENLTVVDQAQAAGGNLTIPSTVQAGDLLILQTFARDDNTTNVTFSSVTGFTTIISGSVSFGIMGSSLHYKIATAADSGATITGGGMTAPAGTVGQRDRYKGLLVVRGEVPIVGVTAGSTDQDAVGPANTDVWLAWKSFSPADSLATGVVVDFTTAGYNGLSSCYLACS